MGQPLISVLLCVYNGEKYVGETLASLKRQTFRGPWELVVIDDCSTDGTPEILARCREEMPYMRIYRNEKNLRLQASLNRGLEKVSGKYLVRMDADDICRRDRLEKQYEYMESHPDISVSSCRNLFLKEGDIIGYPIGEDYGEGYTKARFLFTVPVSHPCVIARLEDLKAIGYDTDYTCTEDLKLWTDLLLAGKKIAVQKDFLLLYRLHPEQITATTSDKQKTERMRIMRRFLPEALGYTAEETESFIGGLYYGDPASGLFAGEYKRLLAANGKRRFFDGFALRRVLAEHLKELWRRRSITPGMLLKGISVIGAGAFWYEQQLTRRLKTEETLLIQEARDIFGDGND